MSENLDSRHDTAVSSTVDQISSAVPDIDDDEAETAALAAAVAEARADPRPSIPHAEVRAWLLELMAGNLDAEPPTG